MTTGYGDNYTTGCLLDSAYFKDNYKIITVDLSKQKALDADPKQFSKYYFKELLDKVIIQK